MKTHKKSHILQKVVNPATFENVNKNVKNAVCAGDFKTRFFHDL